MNKTTFLIFVLFAGVLMTVVAYLSFKSGEHDGSKFSEKKFQQVNDSADKKIDSLERAFFNLSVLETSLRIQLHNFSVRDSVLQVRLEEGEKKLRVIRGKYNELLYIDRLNSDQIKNYFDSAFKE